MEHTEFAAKQAAPQLREADFVCRVVKPKHHDAYLEVYLYDADQQADALSLIHSISTQDGMESLNYSINALFKIGGMMNNAQRLLAITEAKRAALALRKQNVNCKVVTSIYNPAYVQITIQDHVQDHPRIARLNAALREQGHRHEYRIHTLLPK